MSMSSQNCIRQRQCELIKKMTCVSVQWLATVFGACPTMWANMSSGGEHESEAVCIGGSEGKAHGAVTGS